MVEHEVLLTVINWNYNKICDNLSFFKIETQDLPRVFFSEKKKVKYQCMMTNSLVVALTVLLLWNSWN